MQLCVAHVVIRNSGQFVEIVESDALPDARVWRVRLYNGQLSICAVDDARSIALPQVIVDRGMPANQIEVRSGSTSIRFGVL